VTETDWHHHIKAEGRDFEQGLSAALVVTQDFAVPRVDTRVLQYPLIKFPTPTDPGDEWTLRVGLRNPPPAFALSDGHPLASDFPTTDP
jgi:hypothetical protein